MFPKTTILVVITSISEKEGELMKRNMEVMSVLVDVRSIILRKIQKLRQRYIKSNKTLKNL
jgi:hypothetical protein